MLGGGEQAFHPLTRSFVTHASDSRPLHSVTADRAHFQSLETLTLVGFLSAEASLGLFFNIPQYCECSLLLIQLILQG